MSTILIIVLVVVVLVAVALVARGGGPRVTTIEHRRDEAERKDGDDA